LDGRDSEYAMGSRTPESSSLWCATTADGLAKIADLLWRDWPDDKDLRTATSPDEAAATARELARAHGVGHVVRLELTSDFLQRHPGGLVPREARRELVVSLQHAITEHAHYRGGIPEAELDAAQAALGRKIPVDWWSYLRGACWFHRGWMRGGAYVWLYPARMSVELSSADSCPGLFVIGGDGASEQLVVDLREQAPRVLLANVVRNGWEEAIPQAPSLASFLTQIEAGTFEFSFA
jgi:hypothetical protein